MAERASLSTEKVCLDTRLQDVQMQIHKTTFKPHLPLLLRDGSRHSVHPAGEVRLARQIPPQNGSHKV